jgi:hypothetical protein
MLKRLVQPPPLRRDIGTTLKLEWHRHTTMATTKTDEKCHNSKDILTRGLLAR